MVFYVNVWTCKRVNVQGHRGRLVYTFTPTHIYTLIPLFVPKRLHRIRQSRPHALQADGGKSDEQSQYSR